jgi:hypothetical protein
MTTAAIEETYTPYGKMSNLFTSKEPEIILGGAAGTGKSRGNLEYLNYLATEYSRCRLLMLRKTRRSLTESGMVTFEQKVLHPAQKVRFSSSQQRYLYPNGSIMAVGGMDKASKVLSSEWDAIYCQESNEFTEDEWEMCSMRLRNGRLPVQQMLGDVNPGPPNHWIKLRAATGKLHLWETYHENNPTLFTPDGKITPEGERYLARLDQLTGVRYLRYRKGLWVASEGMVYEDSWDRAYNLIDRRPIPKDWTRWLSVDFGYVHPFVCLWGATDPDGRIYIYRQIYKTRMLVEDHAYTIAIASGWFHLLPKNHPRYQQRPADWADPLPREIICDHDAEDRMTLQRHLGLSTTPAKKSVSDGIQAVASRLRLAGDGKPRLMILRDSRVELDRDLAESKKPTCLEDEFEGYIWDTRQGMAKGEQPVKLNDDGNDALRYLIAHLDLQQSSVSYYKNIWG